MFFPVFCNNFFHYNEDLLHLRSLPMKSSFGATIFILWHICIIHFYATFLLKKAENQDNLQLHIFIFNTYWNKAQVPYTALKHKCPLLHLPSCWSALMLCLTGRGQVASSLCQLLCYMLSTHLFHTHKCFWNVLLLWSTGLIGGVVKLFPLKYLAKWFLQRPLSLEIYAGLWIVTALHTYCNRVHTFK